MLRGIAVFSMQGRWQAAIAIALFSTAALVLPPFSYIASGVIALSTLRMGPKEGVIIVIIATVLLTLITGLLLDRFDLSGLFLISSWLPVLGIALVLGYTQSLAISLLAASGLGIICVFGTYLILADPAEWWQQLIAPFFETLGQQAGWQPDQTQALTLSMSSMMTGLIATGVCVNVMLGLLIGRAWQAKLYNPGGFAREFYQLRLGKSAALLAIVLLVLTVLPFNNSLAIARESLSVVLAVFFLQGLSIAHAIVNQQQKRSLWLVAMYILIVIMPPIVVMFAMIGVLEQWFNFRKHSVE